MEELARLTATYGFPMVVAFYLLVRLEKRLTELTSAINQMCSCVERMEVTKNDLKNSVRSAAGGYGTD